MPVLTANDLEVCLSFAEEVASWAIDRIGSRRPEDLAEVDTKEGPGDYVTATDRAVEQHVRGLLHGRFPDHQVIGEEFGTGGGDPGDRVWYVDPVDGTTNYVHGLPLSAFSLALADENGAAVGVVADPYRGEIFSAARGHGARLNDRPLEPDDRTSLSGALVLTEWSENLPWDGLLATQRALAADSCAIRVLGSTALALAYTAAGRASGILLGRFSPWDVLAGVLIARESGRVVLSRHDGGRPVPADEPLPEDGLIVAAPGVADSLRRICAY
ncbi:MAG TPA: inositol monophosphatase family protein [Mycobacteriales bacterium]|nr:inositol monophosphatase family protein [Mycobacteriales bacterium]